MTVSYEIGGGGGGVGDTVQISNFPALQPVTDVTSQDILNGISGLNDTLVTLLSAMLEKMPRVTANDQAAVSVEGNPVIAFTGAQPISTVNNQNAMGNKFISGDNQMMAGCMHIYNNILVS